MGRVEAANATGDAIRRWRPNYMVLVGISGGLKKAGVKLGDVLIADQLADFELQKLTPDGSKIRWKVHRVGPSLLSAAQSMLGSECWPSLAPAPGARWTTKRHIGPLCTCDKVIANGLLSQHRYSTVEMLRIADEDQPDPLRLAVKAVHV
jgi:nucleoside phosphorylase